MNTKYALWLAISATAMSLTLPLTSTAAQPTAVGKSKIMIVGKTADGKYNVYNLHANGDPTLGPWSVGNTLYTENDLIKLLEPVADKDNGHGYECEVVCVDKAHHVVGVLEGYKKLAAKGKKR